MSGLFGGAARTNSGSEPALGGLRVQTSVYGLTVPVVFGRTRVSPNLLAYYDFKQIPHEHRSESGKGGGGGTSTSYTYSATVLMSLGEGVIGGVRAAWAGKEKYSGTTAGTKTITAPPETVTVPSVSPFTVTLSQAATFSAIDTVENISGYWDASPPQLALGRDFTVAAGVITFDPSLAGQTMRVAYTYTIAIDAKSALGQLGLTLKPGADGQAAWSYLTSTYPSQAIGYSSLAYLYGQDYPLDNSAQVPSHSFEVDGHCQFSPTVPDASIADVIWEVLRNTAFGVDFPAAHLASITPMRTYTGAAGLWVSSAYTQQQPARDVIATLLEVGNVDACWQGDALAFVPRGDLAISANGFNYVPNNTPAMAVGPDDLLGVPPVRIERPDISDAPNRVQAEILSRLKADGSANDYNPLVVMEDDDAAAAQFGLRTEEVQSWHMFADASAARSALRMRLQRKQSARATMRLRLGWRALQLQLGDLISVTDPTLPVAGMIAKVLEITEESEDTFSIMAEEFPVGHANAPLLAPQLGSGFSPQTNVDPGSITTPMFVEPPGGWTGTGLEVWAAASGTDPNWGGCDVYCSMDSGSTYKLIGRIDQPCRYGALSAPLAKGSTGPAAVTLTGRGGQLKSVSTDGVDALATLSFIGATTDGEWVSYSTAALTGTNAYNLSGMSRGRFNSSNRDHLAGESFLLVDGAVAESGPLPEALIGKTLLFKFCSYNIFGSALQQLADVSAYAYTVTGRFQREGALPLGNHATAASFPFGAYGWAVYDASGTRLDSGVVNSKFGLARPGAGQPAFCCVLNSAGQSAYTIKEGVGMSVRPGQKLQAFASFMLYNAQVRIGIEYRDNSGNVLATEFGDYLSPSYPNDSSYWSGSPWKKAAEFVRQGLFSIAPANAAAAHMVISQGGRVASALDGNILIREPYIGLADYEQRNLSDWTPSSVAASEAFFENVAANVGASVDLTCAVNGLAEVIVTGNVSISAGTYLDAAIANMGNVSGDLETLTKKRVLTRSSGTVSGSFEIRTFIKVTGGNTYLLRIAFFSDAVGFIAPAATRTYVAVRVHIGN